MSDNHIGLAVVEFALGGHYLDMQGIMCCHRLTLLLLFFIALYDIVDAASHVEVVFADLIVLAFENLLEATNRFLHGNIFTFASSKCYCNGHWLREETLHLASTCDGELILVRQFIDTE